MTCQGLLATCQMTPLCTPRWPTPASRQESVLTRRPFLFQVFVTPVPSWPGCGHPALTAQFKSEKLMVVPSTADGFRAAVSALRSLDGREGVSFHTFTLPEVRCVRLLVKNLGRGMPESVVREQLESLNIRVQGITQLRSRRRSQDGTKERPPTSNSLYHWRGVLRCRKYYISQNSAVCECQWKRTCPQKAHFNASAASAVDTRSESAVTQPGASRVGGPTSTVVAETRGNSLSAVSAGENKRRTTGAL